MGRMILWNRPEKLPLLLLLKVKAGGLGFRNKKLMSFLGILLFFTISCTERFEPQTEIFESALIVEATITNENKRQQILLSRAFRLEEDGPNPESSATVQVTDDQRNEYIFVEEEPGKYLSSEEFSALSGRSYSLSVVTSDGRSYSSEQVILTPSAEITALSASREFNVDGEEGIAILVDNEVSDAEARFFRYEYEETYKIIAPRWVEVDAVVVGNGDTGNYYSDTKNEGGTRLLQYRTVEHRDFGRERRYCTKRTHPFFRTFYQEGQFHHLAPLQHLGTAVRTIARSLRFLRDLERVFLGVGKPVLADTTGIFERERAVGRK